MEITEVRIELVQNAKDRLRGFCTLTFDRCFIVRDVRILEGPQGLFVAMPSRKVMHPCPQCRTKNTGQAHYCNNCGNKLSVHELMPGERSHVDVAHPINMTFRSTVSDAVIAAYHKAVADQHNAAQGTQTAPE